MQWSQCPYCGSQIAPHLSQCPVCGNSLIGQDLPVYGDEPEPKKSEPSRPAPEPRVEYVAPPVYYAPKQYNFFACLLLGLFTFGIYPAFVANDIANDLNTICYGDGRHTPGGLEFYFFGLISFGIYIVIWEYMVADRVQANAPRYGYLDAPGGIAVILWNTIGFMLCGLGPLIAFSTVIDEVNGINAHFSQWLSRQL